MSRPTLARISVAAMRHNLSVARRLARAGEGGCALWAVVKANAYGHGLANALRGFSAADGFALVEFEMAAALRRLGWNGPVLMLEGAFDPADVEQAQAQGLALAVHDAAQVAWLREASPSRPIDVWIKCNSGMNRLGFTGSGVARTHSALSGCPSVSKIGLMSHFANADLPGGTLEAIERFRSATAGLPGPRSLANSAALIAVPEALADVARPGVMLYGGSPFADRSAHALGLRPAMALHSRVIGVQTLAEGEYVGYGATFRAERPMRIGVVACGYADGYPRHAPSGTPVMVDGVRTRTVGRVSMDMLAVDLAPVPAAGVGAPVELWGERVPIDEVASAAGTIGYELMCALAPRVPVEVVT